MFKGGNVGEENYKKRAERNYYAAVKNFELAEEDPFFLNLTGYLLQQTIELYIRHIYYTLRITCDYGHNIKIMLTRLMDLQEDISELLTQAQCMQVFMMADTFTLWESKTRYARNYFLSRRELEVGLQLVGDIITSHADCDTADKINEVAAVSTTSIF